MAKNTNKLIETNLGDTTMQIWTLTDTREPDRFLTMKVFLNLDDVKAMKASFGTDSIHWDIHLEEVIE
jgi:hypothetical protein